MSKRYWQVAVFDETHFQRTGIKYGGYRTNIETGNERSYLRSERRRKNVIGVALIADGQIYDYLGDVSVVNIGDYI